MAGVKIPTVDSIQTAAPTPTVGINDAVPDVYSRFAGARKQLEGGVDDLKVMQEKVEDDAISLEAETIASKYNAQYQKRMVELQKQNASDQDWAAFDQEMHDFKGDLTKDQSWGNRMRLTVDRELTHVDNRNRDNLEVTKATTALNRGKETTNANAYLIGQGALQAATYMDVNNPATLASFDQHISDLQKNRIAEGYRGGQVTVDADGKPIYGPGVAVAVSKDISDVVMNTVQTLNGAGKNKESEYVLDKYKDLVNPVYLNKLKNRTNQTAISNDALTWIASKRDVTDPQKLIQQAEAQFGQSGNVRDLQVLEKIRGKVHTNVVQDEKRTKLAQSVAFDSGMKNIPFDTINTIDQLESNQKYLDIQDHLSAKQDKAIRQMVVNPATSKVEAQETAFKTLFSGGLEGMEPTAFAELQVGLNKQDRTLLRNAYVKANDQTNPEKRMRDNFMIKAMNEEMERQGIFKRNQFGAGLDKKSRSLQLEMYQAAQPYLNTVNANSDQASMHKAAESFVLNYKKNQVFRMPQQPARLETAPDPRGTPPPKKDKAVSANIPPAEVSKAVKAWNAAYPSTPWTRQVGAEKLNQFYWDKVVNK